MKKVLLILVDGMRPDSFDKCGSELPAEICKKSLCNMSAQTVMPSVTLPCHMSLFHSVDPSRHGILTNTYVPQVRPINGMGEVFNHAGKKSAMFYNWEQLRDLTRPGMIAYSHMISQYVAGYAESNKQLAESCADYITKNQPDFTFLYLGYTDEQGHKSGWMTPEYLAAVKQSFECIDYVMKRLPEDYVTIITADHGGHDRGHGSDMPEDMTIPIIINGADIAPGELGEANIIDIAPTIAKLLDVQPDGDWDGHSLL
ncbi:MAG: hypothetical protein HFE63_01770 [Clostridiales bacterium]|nr:hypothetical protein [Clostridiales bacterium]